MFEKDGRVWCGGSLIDPLWLLSAAHCFNGIQSTPVTVTADINNKIKKESSYQMPERIIINPTFNSISLVNDIELLKLERPIQSTKHASTVCLTTLNEVLPVGTVGTITSNTIKYTIEGLL